MSLYDQLFHNEAMDRIYSDFELLQSLLRFEAALARSLFDSGLIPEPSARAIVAKCDASFFDARLIAENAAKSGNVLIPLVRQLTELVAKENKDAARFVHWGATSQDAIDTAAMLRARRALELIDGDLLAIIKTLSLLADRYRETPVVARTWMQQALPTTFGFIVAGWLDALLRDRARLAQMRPRVLALQFGGAVGTLAALHGRGAEVAKALAKDLQLSLPEIPWHSQRDRIAELAATVGVCVGTLGKIARDISLHSQTEIGELSEPAEEGRGGSSSMPHKNNPVTCAVVLAAAQRLPPLINTVLAGMSQEYQRGLGGWQSEWQTIPEIFRISNGALWQMAQMLPHLEVRTERMLANIDQSRGLIFAEAVSTALADRMGKMPAHLLMEAASRKATAERRHLREVLRDEPNLRGHLTSADLESLFDVRNYLGNADLFITQVLKEANKKGA